MQTVKFADRLNAIASNDDLNSKRRFAGANVPLSPIRLLRKVSTMPHF